MHVFWIIVEYDMLTSWYFVYHIIAYLEIKKIEFARDIANVLAESKNHIMLNSDILQMDASIRSRPLQEAKKWERERENNKDMDIIVFMYFIFVKDTQTSI